MFHIQNKNKALRGLIPFPADFFPFAPHWHVSCPLPSASVRNISTNLSWVKMCLLASFFPAPALEWIFLWHILVSDILCDLGQVNFFLWVSSPEWPDGCYGLQFQLLHSRILVQEWGNGRTQEAAAYESLSETTDPLGPWRWACGPAVSGKGTFRKSVLESREGQWVQSGSCFPCHTTPTQQSTV